MKEAHTIYLDLDGVLWNFKQAWIDWFSWTSDDVQAKLAANITEWSFYAGIITDEDFAYRLRRLPVEFWNQPRYITDQAHQLVKWAKDHGAFVKVLTVTDHETACLRGKSKMVKRAFGLEVHGVEKSVDKIGYAKDGCWLIDDKAPTIEKWLATGQDAAIWPASYNKDVGMDEHYFDMKVLGNGVKYTNVTDSPIMQSQPDNAGVPMAEAAKAFAKLGDLLHTKGSDIYDGRSNFDEGSRAMAEFFKDAAVDKKPVLDYDAMDETKKRKMTPMYSGMLAYFPDARALVARNSMVGHYQHNDPADEMYWDRTKSADEMDAMIRHMADHSKDPYDEDGVLHMSKVAWRALAFVQKFIEKEQSND